MPAMLDDPTAPTIYRVIGNAPPEHPGQPLPPTIQPRQVTLRDRTTIATLMPIGPGDHVPPRLLSFLCELLNNEIRLGDTYPMMEELSLEAFGHYWFQNMAAIMLTGDVLRVEELAMMEQKGTDWKEVCMGSFYIKPNYPGRSSHICNGGFLVSNASRNRGVGKLMGEGYLDWAPKLGYVYSVFNLVYETNHASIRIWDSLGFKRIGRVKGCGMLRSSPNGFVDAIIYGRDLGPDSEDLVSEERFDKIRYYLKHQKYPVGADRAEKSRLRSAATHYHLAPGAPGEEEKLMLKDKEVIADQNKQYEIARQMHSQSHGGINKTTATIAEKYHWVRIKETVSLVIKNCTECKENSKVLTSASYTKQEPPPNVSLASKTPPKMAPPTMTPLDGTNTPPMGGVPVRQQQQQQQSQQQQPQPTMGGFEQPLAPSIGGTPTLSRDVSAARQSPIHQQTPVSAASGMPMPQAVLTPRPMPQPPQHTSHPGQMGHPPPMQAHMTQSIIPPHINNHLVGMTMTSAHVTPAGSAVHSPLPNGPASAPISNMQQPFDIHQLDPLLHGMQQYGAQDILDMDTNMQDLSDLHAMGLGDASVHGMPDHQQLGQGPPQGGPMGMAGLPPHHGGPPDGMLDHHDQHGHVPTKHELTDFNADTMMLDGSLDLSKNPNMG